MNKSRPPPASPPASPPSAPPVSRLLRDLAASDLLLLPSSDKVDDYDYYFIVINNDNDCANNDREIFKCPLGEIQLI